MLQIYVLSVRRYVPLHEWQFPDIGLGLTLWDGTYEGITAQWLRWCDPNGDLLLSGAELAAHEHQRAERLTAHLWAMGIDPEA